jgi:membrane protease YdiL (CAAX protease family)
MSLEVAEPPHPGSTRAVAWAATLVLSAAVTVANMVSFHPTRGATAMVIGTVGAVYALFGLTACVWLSRRRELRRRLLPARGDITIGALVAAGSYFVALGGSVLLAPVGSPREAWLRNVYLQIGDPRTTATVVVALAVIAVASLEEIVWRGWIMVLLSEAHGERAGWLITTALYALVHLPAVVLLADPRAGPNPLVMGAAAGLGLLWGWLAMRFGRLGPALFAHALFTWAIVEFPLWRLGPR